MIDVAIFCALINSEPQHKIKITFQGVVLLFFSWKLECIGHKLLQWHVYLHFGTRDQSLDCKAILFALMVIANSTFIK
mgnify:CR=1 FL=1